MNDDLSMIYDILNEIALYLKDDTDNPVSMSLVLHNYGIHDGVAKGKAILATAKVLNSAENTADLTLMDFQRAFMRKYLINSVLSPVKVKMSFIY